MFKRNKTPKPANPNKVVKLPRVRWDAQFHSFGLAALGGQVYRSTYLPPREGQLGNPVGPLAGAEAQVTDPTRRHRVGKSLGMAVSGLGPLALAGMATKDTRAQVIVAFGNGHAVSRQLTSRSEISGAQVDAARFNAIAAAAAAAGSGEGTIV